VRGDRNSIRRVRSPANVSSGATVITNLTEPHKEFLIFLKAVERAVPAGKVIHAIVDNYATHKHPKVLAWLADHPRRVFHFTPKSASWINAVEGFFSAITRRRIRRGAFKSVAELQDAITRYIRQHNKAAKPFAWTKPADTILSKLARLPAPSV
jgi:transposase